MVAIYYNSFMKIFKVFFSKKWQFFEIYSLCLKKTGLKGMFWLVLRIFKVEFAFKYIVTTPKCIDLKIKKQFDKGFVLCYT